MTWPAFHVRNPRPEDLPAFVDASRFPFEFVRLHAGYIKLDTRFPEEPYICTLNATQTWEIIAALMEASRRRYPFVLDEMRAEFARLRRFFRPAVFERDGAFCCRCGTVANLTLDHITPLARGGANRIENLQVLCQPCNSRKGTR